MFFRLRENGHRKRIFSKTLASRLRVDGRTEVEVFEYDDVIHHTRLALRMFCGDALGISTILAFSCGRAKTIRTRNVWTRIFFWKTERPLLLNALTRKGLQADRTGSANTTSVYVPDTTNSHGMYNPYPYMSPPFFGTWENPVGAGVKTKERERDCCSAKTVHSIQSQF